MMIDNSESEQAIRLRHLAERFLYSSDAEALRALKNEDPAGTMTLAILSECLLAPDPDVVVRALEGLREYGDRARPLVPQGIMLLDHEHTNVRSEAITFLLYQGEAASSAIPRLTAILRKAVETRKLAACALAKMGAAGIRELKLAYWQGDEDLRTCVVLAALRCKAVGKRNPLADEVLDALFSAFDRVSVAGREVIENSGVEYVQQLNHALRSGERTRMIPAAQALLSVDWKNIRAWRVLVDLSDLATREERSRIADAVAHSLPLDASQPGSDPVPQEVADVIRILGRRLLEDGDWATTRSACVAFSMVAPDSVSSGLISELFRRAADEGQEDDLGFLFPVLFTMETGSLPHLDAIERCLTLPAVREDAVRLLARLHR